MENQPQTQTQLTVVDLANVHQLLDTAASRGAFRAAEMQQVGEIYNKLTAFLNAVTAQQAAEQPSEEETASTDPEGEENA